MSQHYMSIILSFLKVFFFFNIRTVAPEAIGLVPAVYGAEQKWPCPI